ncbi:MAG: hypothetical protein EXR03_04325 [Pseudolabrys sp.]|nr:hypothetical protein [Pseudolabrys sp.]
MAAGAWLGGLPALVLLLAQARRSRKSAGRALQRNALAETGLGVCVLVLVGALGTIAPTAHMHTIFSRNSARRGIRSYPCHRSHGRCHH